MGSQRQIEMRKEKDINRIFIESVLNKALKEINKSPRRTARNLIDMGVNFSRGRLQKVFLSQVQEFLQNQNSAYYDLITDLTDHVDKHILSTFGMNVGYNGCTRGVKRIREVEDLENFSVPLSLSMSLDEENWQRKIPSIRKSSGRERRWESMYICSNWRRDSRRRCFLF